MVLDLPTVNERLDLFYNDYEQRRSIELFYTIDIDLGFLIEFILCEKLIYLGYNIKRNNYLDRLGIDFLCGNVPFQMKNYSFLLNTDTSIEYANRHKELSTLNFIFYETSIDNIKVCALSGNPYINIKNIDGFTIHRPTEKLSFNDFIDLFTKER